MTSGQVRGLNLATCWRGGAGWVSGAAAVMALGVGLAAGAPTDWSLGAEAAFAPAGVLGVVVPLSGDAALDRERLRVAGVIEAQLFGMLPAGARAAVLTGGGLSFNGVTATAAREEGEDGFSALGDAEYRMVSRWVKREVFDRMRPVHQHALIHHVERLAEGLADGGVAPRMLCFAPDTDPEVVAAFDRTTAGMMTLGDRFQLNTRWSSTATNGGGLQQGDPTTLRYSFVPDGTQVNDLNGNPQSNNLFARLNGLYGSPAVWQQIYTDIFTRWSDVSGLSFVLEPNDDGQPVTGSNTFPGVIGVRGDLRMCGVPLDGNSGVLAFNYFPQVGDMVIDTNDNFYNDLSNSSLRLRNVLWHEHGHGMGLSHVCPRTETKLMEPFISTLFVGPQRDDILAAQRHYGDNYEPNDSTATATPLTVTTTLATVTLASIDDNLDSDFFRLTVSQSGQLLLTARPAQGGAYQQGPQTQACDTTGTSSFDPLFINDLTLQLLDSSAAILATANAGGAGSSESIAQVVSPGTYFARVSGGGADNIQAYELDYRVNVSPTVTVTLPNGAPANTSPAATTAFSVRIEVLNDTLVAGQQLLFYRDVIGGAYTQIPLTLVSGDLYTATIPVTPCGTTPNFYVQARGTGAGTVRLPALAPTAFFTAVPGTSNVVLADDFELDRLWQYGAPGDTATTGIWLRGNPNGTIAQPEDDNTPPPGVNCAFTGQGTVGGAAGEADVDNGFTTLTSPVFSLAGATSATISYWRWYSNNGGGAPNADVFRVQISNDNGATWTALETVGPSGAGTSGGWIQATPAIPGSVALTNAMRIRFIAEDLGSGSLIEAAVDDVSISGFSCVVVTPPCPLDITDNNVVDSDDIFAFLNLWFAGPPGGTCTGCTADWDGNGSINSDDIFAYLNAWFAFGPGQPCP